VNHNVPGMIGLPADGRKAPAPRFPLPKPVAAERSLWAELWALPQAVMWEQLHCGREVAQYVRWKVKAEAGSLDAAKEARQLGDRLGMTPLALLRLRWEVPADEVAQKRSEHPAGSSRQRLVAVDPGAVAGA
jgi:hypothetical protein